MSPDDKSTRTLWSRRLTRLNPTGTTCVNVNKTEADGTIGLALGERIKIVMRTGALTVIVTLLRMHIRGQIVKSVMGMN